jgi:hypothetical protein
VRLFLNLALKGTPTLSVVTPWHRSKRTMPEPPLNPEGGADADDDDPHSLPPKDAWIHSGDMSKKIISSEGVKFQTRFAVLTDQHLFFTKQYDSTYIPKISYLTSEAQLRAVFKQYDQDASGSVFRARFQFGWSEMGGRAHPSRPLLSTHAHACCCQANRPCRARGSIEGLGPLYFA